MSNHQILIVEDEAIVALDLRQTLESLGYGVTGIASSGEAALRSAAERTPDLALVDVRLSGEMDGIETAQAFKDQWAIPVVFLTGHASEEVLERAKVTEPVGFVIKPYVLRNLQTAIEIGLYKHEADQKKKAAERAVLESKRWLETTLSCIGDAVVALDAEGNLAFLNPAAERLFRVPLKQEIGIPFSGFGRLRLFTESDHTTDTSRDGIQSLLLEDDQESIYLERSASPLHDELGRPLGTVYVFRDVTERRRAEQEKAKLEEQLFQAQKMEAIGQLAGGIAHDFNNLLTAIMGNLSLLKQRCPASMIERLDATEHACSRAAELVGKLLTFSKTNEGTLTPISIGPVVKEAVDIARITFDPRIAVETDIDEALPLVKADTNQIHQLVLNLVINARDALQAKIRAGLENPELLIKVTARKHRDPTGERQVAFSVKDTGVGMEEETRTRMFEPFFTTKMLGEGTGLGLSVVYGIVKKYGGQITVASELGEGTEITVFLTSASDPPPAAPPPIHHPPPRKGHETILVVDDERLVRDIVAAMLEELGYTVYSAGGGEEGLKTYREHQHEISLVLSDLAMPDMTGTFLFEQIRELNPSVKLLLSSGYAAGVPEEEKVQKYGVLEKPYKLPELARRIREALEHKEV